ncbi:MAG TPA: methionyl-tRNA formyltransferase [Thermovirgaceae bacterium]|jgi:methionyl-tRNA formyltransferase|nr:methionyl-tRNA formyltransferase [Thermovirgaceae bacterium]
MDLGYPVWFAGSGSFGANCLANVSEEVCISRVITAPPKPAGRKLEKRITPVESRACTLGLPITRTENINTDVIIRDLFEKERPCCVVVVDFVQKIGEPFLSTGPPGCLNIHPSLLPAYRGSAPVQRALMNGEVITGVTVFRLVEEMDAGPVMGSVEVEIGPDDTSGDLFEVLSLKGSRLLVDGLKLYSKGRIPFKEQRHEKATFAPRIQKSETKLSWEKPSIYLHNLVRAMNPSPGTYVLINGKRLKIWKTRPHQESGEPGEILDSVPGNPVVACREGSIELIEVQQEGKNRADGASWIRGTSFRKGDIL